MCPCCLCMGVIVAMLGEGDCEGRIEGDSRKWVSQSVQR